MEFEDWYFQIVNMFEDDSLEASFHKSLVPRIPWHYNLGSSAMILECDKDEEGRDIPLQWYDYVLHFLAFLWKVLFAFIPPK